MWVFKLLVSTIWFHYLKYLERWIFDVSNGLQLLDILWFFVQFRLGISLNPEQWNQLKDQITEIDDAIKRI